MAESIAPALPIEMEACPEKEAAASLSNGYEVQCAQFNGTWKEFRQSWADLLESRQDLKPRSKMEWDLHKDGIRKFHFRHGDRSGMLLFDEEAGRVHVLLKIPIAWCRDIGSDETSELRKTAIHEKPGLEYPKRITHSFVQPRWPYGVPIDSDRILSATISMILDVDGVPRDFCIVETEPELQAIAESAVDAARQWRYLPGTYEDKPVPVAITVKVKFDPHSYSAKGKK